MPYTAGVVDTREQKKEDSDMTHLKEISSNEIEVVPEGHLSRDDMNDFQTWLDRAFQGGHRTIVLNFEGLNTLSSSAIGKILHFKRLCDESGRTLRIRRCSAQMLQLLKMIKFDALIEIEQ
jgi:anti-anti-sigma factor